MRPCSQTSCLDLILAQVYFSILQPSNCTLQIRAEFEALLAENAAKPEAERLPRSAFEIDAGLREMVAAETARREEEARLEMAWDTEKRRLALAKLKVGVGDECGGMCCWWLLRGWCLRGCSCGCGCCCAWCC